MGYKLREIEAESKFSQELSLPAIEHLVPKATIAAVLTAEGRVTQRERKLNLLITVLLVIMINIYTSDSITDVLEKMAQGLRYIWPDPDYVMPNASAITHRRYQVGARPLVALFHQVCQPLASPDTPGAFLFGLRMMAIDGTTEDVADTPANGAVFGRHQGDRGPSAFPQVQGVYLVECGTHTIVDAGFPGLSVQDRLALPHQRTGGGLSPVALRDPWHAGHVGPGAPRLRYVGANPPAGRACAQPFAGQR